MPSPFPGMNPYLENPTLWPGVHSRLIVALADALNAQILPKYRAEIDQRVYKINANETLLVGIPDVSVEGRATAEISSKDEPSDWRALATIPLPVTIPMPTEIRERYLEIREVGSQAVVTAVEVLSPSNKKTRSGREAYEEKRLNILGSRTHLVEIDLLRTGEPMIIGGSQGEFNYRILVSRSSQRPRADLYGFNVPDQIPLFPLPLQSSDPEPIVDLKALLDEVYDRGGYEVVINYEQAPMPPLNSQQVNWLNTWREEKKV